MNASGSIIVALAQAGGHVTEGRQDTRRLLGQSTHRDSVSRTTTCVDDTTSIANTWLGPASYTYKSLSRRYVLGIHVSDQLLEVYDA